MRTLTPRKYLHGDLLRESNFRGHLLRESTFAETYSAKVHHTSNTLKHTLNMHTHTRHTAAPKERGKGVKVGPRPSLKPKSQQHVHSTPGTCQTQGEREKGDHNEPRLPLSPTNAALCSRMSKHSKTLKHSTKHASPKHAHIMHPRGRGKREKSRAQTPLSAPRRYTTTRVHGVFNSFLDFYM